MFTALEKLWGEAGERFNPNFNLAHFFKKAKQDSLTWTQQRLKLSGKQREQNAKTLRLFEGQLTFLFQVHQHVVEVNTAIQEHRDQKETLQFQLSKL